MGTSRSLQFFFELRDRFLGRLRVRVRPSRGCPCRRRDQHFQIVVLGERRLILAVDEDDFLELRGVPSKAPVSCLMSDVTFGIEQQLVDFFITDRDLVQTFG
ncbi:MAG: hypothetical protein MZU97_13680 [Bacillus subtilis]|nr:hypothetical protein [Bacillus subtilis]